MLVEPADREKPTEFRGNQIDGPGPTLPVAVRTKNAFRLEQGDVNRFGTPQHFTVDLDSLFERIDFGPECDDCLSVDFDPAGGYQFLTMPSAPESGCGKNLLQTLQPVVFPGCRRAFCRTFCRAFHHPFYRLSGYPLCRFIRFNRCDRFNRLRRIILRRIFSHCALSLCLLSRRSRS